MFGSLGMPELILILVVALIVFGPKKLPEVGRSLGKAMREFKRTTEEIKGKFEEQINAEEFRDIKNDLADIKREVSGALELPDEIKQLTRDLNAPLDAPPSASPDAAPPPPALPAATWPPSSEVESSSEVDPSPEAESSSEVEPATPDAVSTAPPAGEQQSAEATPPATTSQPAPQVEPDLPEENIAPAPQGPAKDGTTHGEG